MTAKSISLVVLAVGLGFMVSTARAELDHPPLSGSMAEFKPTENPAPVPQISFIDDAGQKLDLTAFKGKITLVNLWATWCAPCVQELPALQKLKAKHDNADFAVVTISEDRGGAKTVLPYLEKQGLTGLTRYLDPQSEIARGIKARGLPTTLLLDRDGREIGRLEGIAEWDGPEAATLIDWYIAHNAAAH